MRNLFRVLLPTLLCLIGGCASKFVEPTSGPTAKLRVRPAGPVTYTWVHTYEKPNCQGSQSMGAIGDPDTLLPAHAPMRSLVEGEHIDNDLFALDAEIQAACLSDWPEDLQAKKSAERIEKIGPYQVHRDRRAAPSRHLGRSSVI